MTAIRTLDTPPHAAIIDLHLDGGRLGIEVANEIRGRFDNKVPLLFLSPSHSDLSTCIHEFGSQCLSKPPKISDIIEFLRMSVVVDQLSTGSPLEKTVRLFITRFELTAAEARIVSALASGRLRAELAAHLGVGANTLKKQIRRLLEKTNTLTTEEVLAALLKAASSMLADQSAYRHHGMEVSP